MSSRHRSNSYESETDSEEEQYGRRALKSTVSVKKARADSESEGEIRSPPPKKENEAVKNGLTKGENDDDDNEKKEIRNEDKRRSKESDSDHEKEIEKRREKRRERHDDRDRSNDRRDRRDDSYSDNRGRERYNDRSRDRYDRHRSYSNRGRDERSRYGEDRNQRNRDRDNGDRDRQRRYSRERKRTDSDEEKENKTDSDRNDRKRKAENDTEGPKAGGGDKGADNEDPSAFLAAKRAKGNGDIMTRTGGAYIPPARLRMMQAEIKDKASLQYQRISWEALKKSINGLINKVNVSNISSIVKELFQENLVRGRGLLAKSCVQAQAASPTFTHVYAALVAIINTKFPQNGELVMKRLILQFKKGYKRNDKALCLASGRFLAHLVNQQVAHEIIALEMLTLLMENPTDDSVEVAVGFVKECGQKLTEVSPKGMIAIFERLRNVLHEGSIDLRVQYMIEVIFATRKDGFKDFPSVIEELDLVPEEDQFTHMLTLDDAVNSEDKLNVFRFEEDFEANEEKYKELKKEILGSDDEDDSGSGSEGDDDSSDDDSSDAEETEQAIIDKTETNLIALRRTIYLTIQSSLDFEECAHKLLKIELKPGQEAELCNMIMDCGAQQRTYEKFFGLLAQRFCNIDKKYIAPYQTIFQEQYTSIHRLETNKLRNVAKFFAHLLHTDAIPWEVLQHIKLNEEDTTSSSRIFIKILFQELSEFMGLPKLNGRLKDETLQPYFEGLFPRDNPRNTRFAINFFTSIGLGGLTDELRNHLKTMPKPVMQKKQKEESSSSSSSSSDDSSSSDSDSSSSSSSTSSSSDSDSSSSESEEDSRSKRRKRNSVENRHKRDKRNKEPPVSNEERMHRLLEETSRKKSRKRNKDSDRDHDMDDSKSKSQRRNEIERQIKECEEKIKARRSQKEKQKQKQTKSKDRSPTPEKRGRDKKSKRDRDRHEEINEKSARKRNGQRERNYEDSEEDEREDRQRMKNLDITDNRGDRNTRDEVKSRKRDKREKDYEKSGDRDKRHNSRDRDRDRKR